MENKFKVGETVKLNPNKNRYSHGQAEVRKEEKGTITSVDGNSYEVDFPSHHHWSGEYDDCIRTNLVETISELQFADILTLRNGERYVVADSYMQGENANYDSDGNMIECCYNEDLTQNEDDKDEDIVKVERAGQVIYERQETLKVTMKDVCEKFGQEVEIIRGDK